MQQHNPQYGEHRLEVDRKVALAVSLREAGNVKRCHTLPIQGEYTVATHSYHAVNLLLVLHPLPSIELIKAVLWHDVAERWLGDTPAPAKWLDEKLKNIIESHEHEMLCKLGLSTLLSPNDEVWLKNIDGLEFLMFCEDQRAMGNRHTVNALNGITGHLLNTVHIPEIRSFLARYTWTRGLELTP